MYNFTIRNSYRIKSDYTTSTSWVSKFTGSFFFYDQLNLSVNEPRNDEFHVGRVPSSRSLWRSWRLRRVPYTFEWYSPRRNIEVGGSIGVRVISTFDDEIISEIFQPDPLSHFPRNRPYTYLGSSNLSCGSGQLQDLPLIPVGPLELYFVSFSLFTRCYWWTFPVSDPRNKTRLTKKITMLLGYSTHDIGRDKMSVLTNPSLQISYIPTRKVGPLILGSRDKELVIREDWWSLMFIYDFVFVWLMKLWIKIKYTDKLEQKVQCNKTSSILIRTVSRQRK